MSLITSFLSNKWTCHSLSSSFVFLHAGLYQTRYWLTRAKYSTFTDRCRTTISDSEHRGEAQWRLQQTAADSSSLNTCTFFFAFSFYRCVLRIGKVHNNVWESWVVITPKIKLCACPELRNPRVIWRCKSRKKIRGRSKEKKKLFFGMTEAFATALK